MERIQKEEKVGKVKWRTFRKRKVLSPLARGSLLLAMFGLWFTLANFNLFATDKDLEWTNQDFPAWKVRHLLNASLTPIGDDVDAYDEEGNLKKGFCVRPAIEQFPQPLIGQTGRVFGGILFYVFFAVYMFVGLAIVCDDYFVPSLDKIADSLNMDPDVAGATFMAAGSSGPELATAIIGVFVAKDDIGVSGVIGSAVFNITLVIAVCALAAEQILFLNWYSVVRDCTCYLLSIIVLLCTIGNEIVSWPEALFFILLYVAYCVAMAFNSRIEEVVRSKVPVPESWNVTKPAATTTSGKDANNDLEGGYDKMADANKRNGAMEMTSRDGMTEVPMSPPHPDPRAPPPVHAVEPIEDPLEKPMDGGMLKLVKWVLTYPLYFMSKWTIPDCRKPQMTRFYVATFIMAIAWISLYSYLMVWMITVVGFTLNVPDTVMGLTFIAAGVSVPDALSGIAVVKEGHGDMAVSNAIGSNVFDILICLGLPWFLETAIVEPGSDVRVRSKGLVYSTFSLFSTVLFLIVASHFNGWKLDKKYGITLLIWYFIFMIFAALYEFNVFGQVSLPECDSSY